MRIARGILVALLLGAPAAAIEVEGPVNEAAQPAASPAESDDEAVAEPGYDYLPSSPLLRNAQLRRRARQAAAGAPEAAAQAASEGGDESATVSATPAGGGFWIFLSVALLGGVGGVQLWRRVRDV